MPASITARRRWAGWTEPDQSPRDAVPLFPIPSFVPDSACPHRGPIQEGSQFVCMKCHDYGLNAHPMLTRDPRTDPKPEPVVVEAEEPEPTRAEKKAGEAGRTSGKMQRRKARRKAEAA